MRNGITIFIDPNSPNKQKYLNGDFDKSLEAMKKAFKANKQQTRASAPPVSAVYILHVCSEKMLQTTGYDCEEIADGQGVTRNDHSGNPFLVTTAVEGYGGAQYDSASFAGNKAKQLSSEGVDVTGDKIVDGFLDIWDISYPANLSGNFIFTSQSILKGASIQRKDIK